MSLCGTYPVYSTLSRDLNTYFNSSASKGKNWGPPQWQLQGGVLVGVVQSMGGQRDSIHVALYR